MPLGRLHMQSTHSHRSVTLYGMRECAAHLGTRETHSLSSASLGSSTRMKTSRSSPEGLRATSK